MVEQPSMAEPQHALGRTYGMRSLPIRALICKSVIPIVKIPTVQIVVFPATFMVTLGSTAGRVTATSRTVPVTRATAPTKVAQARAPGPMVWQNEIEAFGSRQLQRLNC